MRMKISGHIFNCVMTFQEVYKTGTEQLAAAGIKEASLDAWYLLEHVTGIGRAVFLADPGKVMEDVDKDRYLELIECRAARIPLQHITGVQEFMGLEFQVNRHVLIPRQDTEILVETALEELNRQFSGLCNGKKPKRQARILDMCTGSGCILLSTLFYAREEAGRYGLSVGRERSPVITGLGVDISPDALRVAEQNGRKLRIEAEWLESNLFAGVKGTFDMILSNPPYIPSAVIETLQPEVRDHDPRIALDGEEDGLCFYRRIVKEGRQYLKPGGHLIFEIGSDQGEIVSSYMKEYGYKQVIVKKDLAGLDRVVSGVYDDSVTVRPQDRTVRQ